MFRHVDRTQIPREYNGNRPSIPVAPEATRTGEPTNWPDSHTNGKYFVFLHGYNVDGQEARGWHAEVFKRLHVMGSNARFVGVTWHGATGLDYHKAVYHAFQTGDALAQALQFVSNSSMTIAAHSLGNMVVSHSMQQGGLSPRHYFMINAATPIEAYALVDVRSSEAFNMTESSWRDYEPRLCMANWHSLFGAADNRGQLTWKELFVRVPQNFNTYNFYSEQENVVSDSNENSSASIVATMLQQGFNLTTGAWKAQELVKGVGWTTSLASWFMKRGQAGWGFNADWDVWVESEDPDWGTTGVWERREPEQTSMITNEILKTKPFFGPFFETTLIGANLQIASATAGDPNVRYDLFARAIPAMSNAVAANRLASLGDNNFPMHTNGKALNNVSFPTPGGQWRHSDFVVVALPFVYPMYEEMIKRGDLK